MTNDNAPETASKSQQYTYRITPEVMAQMRYRHVSALGDEAWLLHEDEPATQSVLDLHHRILRGFLFRWEPDRAKITITITDED